MLTFRINSTIYEEIANVSSNVNFLQIISPNLFFFINTIIGILILPLFNHIFIPSTPSLTMRGRIAIGMVINIAAILSAIGIESGIKYNHDIGPLQVLGLYILPTILITLPEVFTTMSGALPPSSLSSLPIITMYAHIAGLLVKV